MVKTITVALIGNPNTGKSSVFNSLTGLKQKVGNYPGVTVEKKIGSFKVDRTTNVQLIDLPGTYGLNTQSLDQSIVFDLLLPKDSLFRNAATVGTAITVSGITTGYYFTVFNSNVGASVTSLYQNGTVVGIGTSFLDNVYEVASVSIGQTMGIGIGLTYVAQVTVSVQDYNGLTGLGHSEFFGEYSWGRIQTSPRGSARVFTSYAGNSTGLSGISSSPIIERVNPLRYVNYNT